MISYAHAFPGSDAAEADVNAICPPAADPAVSVESKVMTDLLLEDIYARLDDPGSKTPYGHQVLLMMLAGYQEKDIANHFGVSQPLMHYWIRKVRSIAADVLIQYK